MNLICVEIGGKNAVSAWQSALAECLKQNADGVFFPEGTYHFYSEGCREKFLHVSNNDAGVKRIAFHLDGLKHFTLAGNNARLVFHGRILPMAAEDCEDLVIRGFTIDFERQFASECRVLECSGGMSAMQIEDDFTVEDGRLRFFDDPLDNLSGILRFSPYDMTKERWDIRPKAFYASNRNLKVDGQTVMLPVELPVLDDQKFILRHQGRHTPGLLVSRCRNTEIQAMLIHAAEGMGVVVQSSENLHLDGIRIVPAEGRILSVTDDGVHCSDCWGKIVIENCEFRNMLDDAVNVHGIYRRLRQRILPECSFVMLETGHFQQFGLSAGKAGDRFELLHSDTMEPYAVLEAKEISDSTPQVSVIEFTEPLPDEYRSTDCARNLNRVVDELVVRNNIMVNNRPRGVLATGIRNLLIEQNSFTNPGAGVYISGDANFWFESGPVEQGLVRQNRFLGCCYISGATGSSPVTIYPEIPAPSGKAFYHGRLEIRENEYRDCPQPPVLARSVRDLCTDCAAEVIA